MCCDIVCVGSVHLCGERGKGGNSERAPNLQSPTYPRLSASTSGTSKSTQCKAINAEICLHYLKAISLTRDTIIGVLLPLLHFRYRPPTLDTHVYEFVLFGESVCEGNVSYLLCSPLFEVH